MAWDNNATGNATGNETGDASGAWDKPSEIEFAGGLFAAFLLLLLLLYVFATSGRSSRETTASRDLGSLLPLGERSDDATAAYAFSASDDLVKPNLADLAGQKASETARESVARGESIEGLVGALKYY